MTSSPHSLNTGRTGFPPNHIRMFKPTMRMVGLHSSPYSPWERESYGVSCYYNNKTTQLGGFI
jgi:hypothetical protein